MKTLRMALIALCGFAMTVGASSCKKDKKEDSVVGEKMRIEVSVNASEGNAKTHLNGNAVVWDNADEFMLYPTVSTQGTSFGLEEITGDGTTAVFEGDCPGNAPYYACYPSEDVTCSEVGKFVFDIPQSQSENTNAGPMVGYMESQDADLVFQNAMSWLNIGMKGNALVKKVTLTDKSDNAILNGTLTVEMNGNEIVGRTMAGGNNMLTIVYGNGIQLQNGDTDDTYTWFSFLVPANSFTGNDAVEIKVYGADSDNPIKTFTKNLGYTDEQGSHQGVEPNMIYSPKISEAVQVPVPSVELIESCVSCTRTLSGKITIPGGGTETCEYGVVYSKTNTNPMIGGEDCQKMMVTSETIAGSKDFSVDIAQLNDGPYYMCAYAIGQAVGYSEMKVPDLPMMLASTWSEDGLSPKQFSVSGDKRVYFSRGNLQYNATGSSASVSSGENVGGTWRFAEHQFDIIGEANMNVAQTYTGWIDQFGWGTSGFNHGAVCYQPWSKFQGTAQDFASFNSNFALYSNMEKNFLSQNPATADWGYNCISNGGNQLGQWRTLSGTFYDNQGGEWNYLINGRTNAGNLWGSGKVGCMNGLILLPDEWDWSASEVAEFYSKWKPGSQSDWVNAYTYLEWAKMEKAGAVFLPAGGSHLYYDLGTHVQGETVSQIGVYGRYWSSIQGAFGVSGTSAHPNGAFYIAFTTGTGYNPTSDCNRYNGFQVRLVRDANK